MGVLLFARHGQASFGAADYDQLSEAGTAQARQLGVELSRRGFTPSLVVSGSLKRQQETARLAVAAAGWGNGVEIDPRWDEYDHDQLAATQAAGEPLTDSEAFQDALEVALDLWCRGDAAPIQETFEQFRARAARAFDGVVDAMAGGNALVVSSAGVISWLATTLMAGTPEQWIRLNRVCVNAALTTVVVGRRGRSLVSFNEHGYLDLISYR